MNNYTFSDGNKNYKRIDKRTARRAFDNGLTVVFCPCNLRPFTPWHCETDIQKSRCDGYSFDYMVNLFEVYNCRDSETGKYTAFYIES